LEKKNLNSVIFGLKEIKGKEIKGKEIKGKEISIN